MRRRGRSGFTLIELMIVVAIIGVLASIALPKFANLIVKSKESAVKGNLGAIRSAVSIYYSDNEGNAPVSAAFLEACLTTGSKYMRVIPPVAIPPPANHPGSNQITGTLSDVGQWFYTSASGHVAVSCTHTDTRGSTISLW